MIGSGVLGATEGSGGTDGDAVGAADPAEQATRVSRANSESAGAMRDLIIRILQECWAVRGLRLHHSTRCQPALLAHGRPDLLRRTSRLTELRAWRLDQQRIVGGEEHPVAVALR
jgi:hypothetical protein